MNLIRRSFARLTGLRAGQLTGPPARSGRSGRDGFAGRFIQDMAAAANVAVGHQPGQRRYESRRFAEQNRPAAATTMPWPDAVTASGLRAPHTVQLCIHCRQSPAGFWVSRRGGQTVRRPWCLSCCQELDRDRCDVTAFDS
jgi:hypothetical protein